MARVMRVDNVGGPDQVGPYPVHQWRSLVQAREYYRNWYRPRVIDRFLVSDGFLLVWSPWRNGDAWVLSIIYEDLEDS